MEKLLVLATVADLAIFMGLPLLRKKGVLGRPNLSLIIEPGQVEVIVTGTITGTITPIEYFDLSYYVNDALQEGYCWSDIPDTGCEPNPPQEGESREHTWTYVFPSEGSYDIHARLYARNVSGESIELFTEKQNVVVEKKLSGTVSLVLAY